MKTSLLRGWWHKLWSNCPACGNKPGDEMCVICRDWTTDINHHKTDTWIIDFWWRRFLILRAFNGANHIAADNLFNMAAVYTLVAHGWTIDGNGKWIQITPKAKWILPIDEAISRLMKENAKRYTTNPHNFKP